MVRERQSVREQIVEAEEEQAFLQKLASVEIASPKRITPQKSNDGGDGSSPLVSFFNNLLRTKEGQVGFVLQLMQVFWIKLHSFQSFRTKANIKDEHYCL